MSDISDLIAKHRRKIEVYEGGSEKGRKVKEMDLAPRMDPEKWEKLYGESAVSSDLGRGADYVRLSNSNAPIGSQEYRINEAALKEIQAIQEEYDTEALDQTDPGVRDYSEYRKYMKAAKQGGQ